MLKRIFASLVLLFTLTVSVQPLVYAEDDGKVHEGSAAEEDNKSKVNIANKPSECVYKVPPAGGDPVLPVNCLFLEEPIGGRQGFDLFLETCITENGKTTCKMELWKGGAIPKDARGPIQAVLTFDPEKPYEGPFGLLYNYLGLIYSYMSGLIIAVAILFVVVGGIQMSTSGGDTTKFDAGKSRITKAIVGIILWFTASLILYTINPTFFAF